MPPTPPPQLAGFQPWEGEDPYENHTGPYFFKRDDDGCVAGFVVGPHHLNASGAVHGGALMSFADYALFAIASDELEGGSGVTISLNGEFTDAGLAGDVVLSRGEVVRATGSMVFVRGTITAGEGADMRTLLNYSGIIRKLRRK